MHVSTSALFSDIRVIVTSGQRVLITDRIAGGFSLGKFNLTVDCFCGQPIGTVVDSMRANPDGIVSKVPLPVGDLDPRLIHSSFDPPESTFQTAARSVQPFLQGSRLLQTDRPTDRQTDRPRYSVCSNRPHPASVFTE